MRSTKKPAAAALDARRKRISPVSADKSDIHDLLRLSMAGRNAVLRDVFIVHLGSLKAAASRRARQPRRRPRYLVRSGGGDELVRQLRLVVLVAFGRRKHLLHLQRGES